MFSCYRLQPIYYNPILHYNLQHKLCCLCLRPSIWFIYLVVFEHFHWLKALKIISENFLSLPTFVAKIIQNII